MKEMVLARHIIEKKWEPRNTGFTLFQGNIRENSKQFEKRASGKLVTLRCNRRNNEICHCYNLQRIRCNNYKLFYVTISLQHIIVVTILLHRINDVTIRIGCNGFVKRCNNVKIQIFVVTMTKKLCNTDIFRVPKGLYY